MVTSTKTGATEMPSDRGHHLRRRDERSCTIVTSRADARGTAALSAALLRRDDAGRRELYAATQ
jgi:hypothetical protein